MCGMKDTIGPACRAIADLECQLEIDLAQASDGTVAHERAKLLFRGDKRALDVLDSFDRVRAIAGKETEYDLKRL